MKEIMKLKTNDISCNQGIANEPTNGDCSILASTTNEFFVYVNDLLPRLNTNHNVVTVNEELSVQYAISLFTLLSNNIPARVLRNHANVF